MASVNVKTHVRLRPQNVAEKMMNKNPKEVIQLIDTETIKVLESEARAEKFFTFDGVYNPAITQEDMFNLVGKDICDSVLGGFNATLFAYGQTGSGKTFSLVGDMDDHSKFGILPRVGAYIFEMLENDPDILEWSVSMDVCENYMNKLKDLLRPNEKELKIRTSRDKKVYVEGIKCEYVSDLSQLFEQMTKAFSNRSVGKTNMNEHSSRSHCVFGFKIKQKMRSGASKSARLFIIDLAGSERVSKTGADGQTFEEAKAINSSLSILGNVINALSSESEMGKKKHVPFRDSILTFLLKDSLSGNTKTNLLLCATLDSWNLEETVSTLQFGARAKMIKTNARRNVELSGAQMKSCLKEQKKWLVNSVRIFNSVKAKTKKEYEKHVDWYLRRMKDYLKKDFTTKCFDGDGAEDEMEDELTLEEAVEAATKELQNQILEIQDELNHKKHEAISLANDLKERDDEIEVLLDEVKAFNENQVAPQEAVILPNVDGLDDKSKLGKLSKQNKILAAMVEQTRIEWRRNQNLAISKLNSQRKSIKELREENKQLLDMILVLEKTTQKSGYAKKDSNSNKEVTEFLKQMKRK